MSLRKGIGQLGELDVPKGEGACSSCDESISDEFLCMSGDEMYCKTCAQGTLPIPDCPIAMYRWCPRNSKYLIVDLHIACADHCSSKCTNWFHMLFFHGSMPRSYEERCSACLVVHQLANRITQGQFAFPSAEDLQMMRVAELKKVRTDMGVRIRFRSYDNTRDKLLQLLERMRGDAERACACPHVVN